MDNLVLAIQALDLSNYVPIDDADELGLLRETNTPEAELIHKQRIEELSDEALFVWNIIIDTPNEIAQMMELSEETSPKGRLKHVLRMMGWKHRVIRSVWKELRKFVA